MKHIQTVMHNGKRYQWFEEDDQVEELGELCCVARLGNDGAVIPSSRLSSDFSSPRAAIAARDALLAQHPDAAIFGSRVVDRLAGAS